MSNQMLRIFTGLEEILRQKPNIKGGRVWLWIKTTWKLNQIDFHLNQIDPTKLVLVHPNPNWIGYLNQWTGSIVWTKLVLI